MWEFDHCDLTDIHLIYVSLKYLYRKYQNWNSWKRLQFLQLWYFLPNTVDTDWAFFLANFQFDWKSGKRGGRKNHSKTNRFWKKHPAIRRKIAWNFCRFYIFLNQLITEIVKFSSLSWKYLNRSKLSITHCTMHNWSKPLEYQNRKNLT